MDADKSPNLMVAVVSPEVSATKVILAHPFTEALCFASEIALMITSRVHKLFALEK